MDCFVVLRKSATADFATAFLAMTKAPDRAMTENAMTWRDFFDSDHSIYVSARHKLLHSQLVADGVASLYSASPMRACWISAAARRSARARRGTIATRSISTMPRRRSARN